MKENYQIRQLQLNEAAPAADRHSRALLGCRPCRYTILSALEFGQRCVPGDLPIGLHCVNGISDEPDPRVAFIDIATMPTSQVFTPPFGRFLARTEWNADNVVSLAKLCAGREHGTAVRLRLASIFPLFALSHPELTIREPSVGSAVGKSPADWSVLTRRRWGSFPA